MPLLPAKCSNCGANLQVDNTQSVMVCPYCKCSFVVQQAIYNYNITKNININANVVNIYNVNSQPKASQINITNHDFIIKDNVLKSYIGSSTIVNIPYGVLEISAECFMGNNFITKVIIPNTVTKIGKRAFKDCPKLKEIVASQKLWKMYASMFESAIGMNEQAVNSNKSHSQQIISYSKPKILSRSERKSVVTEYTKAHPEQFNNDKNKGGESNITFLDILLSILSTIMDSPKYEEVIKYIIAFLAICPVLTLWILVQGKDFKGVEYLPIITAIEIIIMFICWIDYMIKKK